MSEGATQRDEASTGEVNLVIFEELFGATRELLAEDVCGLLHAGVMHGSFTGHDRFDDEEVWAEHYQGPDFCGDLVRMFEVEERLASKGWQRAYAEALALGVCPNYQRLKNTDEVLDFWYALAHASPVQRARAVAWVVCRNNGTLEPGAGDRAQLEQIVERAIELALPMAAAKGDAMTTAGAPFREFVKNLEPQWAEDLIAVMYLGRGDQPSFAAMRKVVAGWSVDQHALAQQMYGKGPLVRYLRDGLAKLRSEVQQRDI